MRLNVTKRTAGCSSSEKTSSTSDGQIAADITLTSFDGKKETSLKNLYTEKPVYLNFWATWCPPCVHEIPDIDKMYKKYGDKINFVMIPIDDNRQDVIDFLKDKNYSLPIYYADLNKIDHSYTLQAIPVSIIIDKDGKILSRHVGGMSEKDLENFLKPLLNK